MQSATLVSVEEYLSTSYRPDREYVDGVVQERNLGEWDHSRLQSLLCAYLVAREKQWNIKAVPEQRVQVRPNRFRIPDVCAITAEPEPILTRPPFLCVEILSKDDTMTGMLERINDYLAFGVKYVWIVDPRTRRAYIYTDQGMQPVNDGILRTSGPDIEVPLSAVFEP